jgi:Glycosyl transferase family 2
MLWSARTTWPRPALPRDRRTRNPSWHVSIPLAAPGSCPARLRPAQRPAHPALVWQTRRLAHPAPLRHGQRAPHTRRNRRPDGARSSPSRHFRPGSVTGGSPVTTLHHTFGAGSADQRAISAGALAGRSRTAGRPAPSWPQAGSGFSTASRPTSASVHTATTAAQRDHLSSRDGGRARVIVLIPAHNEAPVIAATIASLRRQTRPPDRIIVVADNCSDAT